jgi:hypothetical protein
MELREGKKKAMPQPSREVRSEPGASLLFGLVKASTAGTDVTAVPLNDKALNPQFQFPRRASRYSI